MILYLAHPVAPFTLDGASYTVADNLASARAWLRFLVRHTDHAVLAPWIPYVEALDDGDRHDRERGMRDDLAILTRAADGIVLAGGRLSSGMAEELETFRARDTHEERIQAIGTTPTRRRPIYARTPHHRRAPVIDLRNLRDPPSSPAALAAFRAEIARAA